ncbi:MAG: RsmB/NOP family class I SAM-dependent RNA methyltransferase [Desulfohalobiaceae bacterium]
MPSRCFRLVCSDFEAELVEELLWQEGYRFRKLQGIPWARELLAQPKALGSSLAAEFGLIYIQDKSSLLPPWCLSPALGSRILDLCASPGSKSGYLAQLAGVRGLVLANEPWGRRSELLRRNMARLNLPQVVCCTWQAQELPLPGEAWSNILLDVPCSGWGTAEKHPRVLKLWQGKRLNPLLKLQQELLTAADRLLAPGGSLLYSTCTTNRQENEEQVQWAEDNLGLVPENLFQPPGFVLEEQQESMGCLRVDGSRSGGQSFFLARLKKPAAAQAGLEAAGVAGIQESDAACELDPGLQDFPGSLSRLPQGRIRLQGERILFQPRQASLQVPSQAAGQGLYLGRKMGSGIRLWPRARLLVPNIQQLEETEAWQTEDTSDLHRLLSGQSLPSGSSKRQLPLYWRDLALGWLTIKGGRALWSDKG